MKKLLTILFIIMLVSTAFSQTINFDQLQSTFDDFASDIAPSIPTLANVGLQWSDSWVGFFPHFGVGASVGTAFVPVKTFDNVFTALGQDSGVLDDFPSVGVPLPAVSVEGRIGGLVFPFDIGIKAGFIPGALVDLAGDSIESLDYQMFGFDVRYALVKENLVMPEISVGIGYTNLSTNIKIPLGGNQTVGSWQVPVGVTPTGEPIYENYSLVFADPSAEFGWTSNIIDLKAQISKSFLIVTPYLGAGVSFGLSNVGGGITTTPTIYDGSNHSVDIDTVKAYFDAAGQSGSFPDLSTSGISFFGDYNSPAFRIYGGTSVNLLMLKLDISGMLNPVTMALGGQLSFRIQL